jgi:hypothetical protein
MSWLERNKWFIFAIVAFFVLFYWFGVRPVVIRANCEQTFDIGDCLQENGLQ